MTPVVVFFGAADDFVQQLAPVFMDRADEIGAVVHRDMRLVIQRRVNVLVIGFVVLALDGVDRYLVVGDERSGHVVLRRERVGGGQHDIGAAGLQRLHEVGGLGGDVQAGGKAQAFERLFLFETFLDLLEHRHLLPGPLDTVAAAGRQFDVFYVVCDRHILSCISRMQAP